MALTPEGTPYVEASDLVADYPATSLALANRVDLVGVLPFATSAARATAITSPTDGQFTYLQDTNSPEFFNGTAYQAVGVAPGLVLVEPTTIANTGGTATKTNGQVVYSGVTSVSLNGVFSATYQNYAIVMSVTTVGVANPELRYRAAGTDSTGSNYVEQFIRAINATLSGLLRTRSAQEIILLGLNNSYEGTIFAPFDAAPTANFFNMNSETGIASLTCRNTLSTSFDGFTLTNLTTSTFSGTIRVYGYDNS